MSIETDARQAIANHAETLNEYDTINERYKTLMAVFEDEHAELIAARKSAKSAVGATDKTVRESVMTLFTDDTQAWAAFDDEAIKVAMNNVALYDERTLWRALVAYAPIYLKVNDVAIQDLAKAEVSARTKYIASMDMVLPELTFARVPFVQISDAKLIARVRGSV